MSWPATAVATGELITAAQMNGLPVRIADTTLSGSAASIDFTSIPDHYAHLMVVAYLRTDEAVVPSAAFIRLNNDSGANHDYQYMNGVAGVAAAGEFFGQTKILIGNCPGASAGANLFGALTLEIPHYAGAANNKSVASQWARKYGTATTNLETGQIAGFWRSSAAINRLTLLPNTGNFVAGSRATLYGMA